MPLLINDGVLKKNEDAHRHTKDTCANQKSVFAGKVIESFRNSLNHAKPPFETEPLSLTA